jgi:hypothetical protein
LLAAIDPPAAGELVGRRFLLIDCTSFGNKNSAPSKFGLERPGEWKLFNENYLKNIIENIHLGTS